MCERCSRPLGACEPLARKPARFVRVTHVRADESPSEELRAQLARSFGLEQDLVRLVGVLPRQPPVPGRELHERQVVIRRASTVLVAGLAGCRGKLQEAQASAVELVSIEHVLRFGCRGPVVRVHIGCMSGLELDRATHQGRVILGAQAESRVARGVQGLHQPNRISRRLCLGDGLERVGAGLIRHPAVERYHTSSRWMSPSTSGSTSGSARASSCTRTADRLPSVLYSDSASM